MTRRAWTASDDAALRGAVAARRSAAEIAPDLGRTTASVRMRMTKLRLRLYPALTRADVDVVAELYAVGTPLKRIAARLGVRPAQIVHVVRTEGLVNARSYSVGDDLPFDAEIQRLSAEGIRVAEIARRVGEPAVRVRGRLVTLARREVIAEAQSSLSSPRSRIADANPQETA